MADILPNETCPTADDVGGASNFTIDNKQRLSVSFKGGTLSLSNGQTAQVETSSKHVQIASTPAGFQLEMMRTPSDGESYDEEHDQFQMSQNYQNYRIVDTDTDQDEDEDDDFPDVELHGRFPTVADNTEFTDGTTKQGARRKSTHELSSTTPETPGQDSGGPVNEPATPSLCNSKVTWKNKAAFGATVGLGVGLSLGTVLACTAQGAAWGTAIGTVCPGLGNAFGLVLGALGGTAWGVLAVAGVTGALTGTSPVLLHQGAAKAAPALKQLLRKGQSAFQRLADKLSGPLQIDWTMPVHLTSIKSKKPFTTQVQKSMNLAVQTTDPDAPTDEAKSKSKPKSDFDENHVHNDFINDLGRMNITLCDGRELQDISKVLSKETNNQGKPTFKRIHSRNVSRVSRNTSHVPDDSNSSISSYLGGGNTSARHERTVSRSSSKLTVNPSKLEMIKGTFELPVLLGGNKATEIVTSSLHQGIFASVLTALNVIVKPGDGKPIPNPDGKPIPNPFGCALFCMNAQEYVQGMKTELSDIENEIEDLESHPENTSQENTSKLEARKKERENIKKYTPTLYLSVTNKPGVFTFSARHTMPVNRFIVDQDKFFNADPAQSDISISLEGTIDTTKQSDHITLDEGCPKLSLNFVPSKHS